MSEGNLSLFLPLGSLRWEFVHMERDSEEVSQSLSLLLLYNECCLMFPPYTGIPFFFSVRSLIWCKIGVSARNICGFSVLEICKLHVICQMVKHIVFSLAPDILVVREGKL